MEIFDFVVSISTKEKGRHQPSFFFGGSERTRGSVQAASKKRKRDLSATNGSGERLAQPIRRMGCGFRLPSPPPLIFTYVKTSEKHRHGQALLAMSVFAFWGQDRVAKNKIARFCQIKSRQSREGGWDFEARMGAWRPCKLWAGGSG